jgi:hypothetical protein
MQTLTATSAIRERISLSPANTSRTAKSLIAVVRWVLIGQYRIVAEAGKASLEA